ncbi:MAG: cupin [Rhodospirillaceae bacterium]|nr:cupin [Magnetovibrio sp.]MAY67088.1 cupin [Rhodospirillaceae bacterium]
MKAADVIKALGLAPHPEGGHFREIHRDAPPGGGRGAVTSIYYLLAAGERSHWHRVDAVEIWNFHAAGGSGAAGLALSVSPDGKVVETHLLGENLTAGQSPQAVVPADWWQAAALADASSDGWVLVGCTVAPAFDFAGFEMAPPGWAPTDWKS